MPVPQSNTRVSRLRALLDGLGEVATFAAACFWAVVQFCLGRWPEFSRPRKGRGAGRADDIAESEAG